MEQVDLVTVTHISDMKRIDLIAEIEAMKRSMETECDEYTLSQYSFFISSLQDELSKR